MKILTLLYHDVVAKEYPDSSGLSGAGAALYKLTPDVFESHLTAIAAVTTHPLITTKEIESKHPERPPVLLTFDDGGVSAFTHIADKLEQLGWRGHFLVTTKYIGDSTFLSPEQIRSLHERGHVIGSHSHSHPARMSSLNRSLLAEEWGLSVARLSEIIGENVTVASVPGGYYSKQVAEAASDAGIRILFTSEPTVYIHTIKNCLVLGRYAITNRTSASTTAAILSTRPVERWKQEWFWKFKSIAKSLGGETYILLRRQILQRTKI